MDTIGEDLNFNSRNSIASWIVGLNETVSASLIRMMLHVPLSCKDKQNFCLGLISWCSCDDCQSLAKMPVKESVKIVPKQ